MTNGAAVELGKRPVKVSESQIIKAKTLVSPQVIDVGLKKIAFPTFPAALPPDQTLPGMGRDPFFPWTPAPLPEPVKRLALNIETTGFDPLKDKLIAIGYQDTEKVDEAPIVIMLADEKTMIEQLISIIQAGDYKEIVGYGLSFDYRFILLKAMKHGITIKEFYDLDLYDLMQAAAQGKFSFVYYAQKPPSLSNLADYLWSFPKPFTDAEMLKYYQLGEINKVIEFTSSQITRIMALYHLFRFITENPFVATLSNSPGPSSLKDSPPTNPGDSLLTIPEANAPGTITLNCKNCLAGTEFPTGSINNICPICGAPLN